MVYYSFTSLSTVGFGDLAPVNEFERLFIAYVLLIGVAIFSYILGQFIETVEIVKAVEADLDDFDNLGKFSGMIKNFNKGIPMNSKLK